MKGLWLFQRKFVVKILRISVKYKIVYYLRMRTPLLRSELRFPQKRRKKKDKRKEKRTNKMFLIIGTPGDFNRIESNEAAGDILIVIR